MHSLFFTQVGQTSGFKSSGAKTTKKLTQIYSNISKNRLYFAWKDLTFPTRLEFISEESPLMSIFANLNLKFTLLI